MAIAGFVYQASPQRIVFGSGTLAGIADEVARLGVRRALVLSTPGHRDEAERVAALMGPAAGGIFAEARMHTPVEVTEAAMQAVAAASADGTVAIGGGSTIGLGKAIALRTGFDQVAVPTTYAGSEMTDILGETTGGRKATVRDPRVVPETVIYDVDLTLGLPVALSVTSGLNAVAHAVEGLYARNGNPVLSLMAEEGIRAFATALPVIAANPLDVDSRTDALYGAWLSATVLAGTEMALHHKLCHVLGGAFGLPHAETHAIVLPHALAFNAPAVAEAMRRMGRALGDPDPPSRLFDLARDAGAPKALREIGMPGAGLDRAADLSVANPYWNPRPFTRDDIRALLDDAWHGRRPMART
jgi:alcohol dehydrogenase class IV